MITGMLIRAGIFHSRIMIKSLYKQIHLKKYPKNIYITGEVKFPGAYSILNNTEKLSNFIKRAGGLKSTAYTDGIYVFRKNPIFNEFEQDTTGLPDSTKKEL